MAFEPIFEGLVLAAGRSSRMGQDKALLPHTSGLTLWRAQIALLRTVGARRAILSVREDQTWAPPEVPRVQDTHPDAGPLAGIAAALEASCGTHLLVLAVDLPQMEVAWFKSLRGLCQPGVGAVGRRDGIYEPLAAIYPRELAPSAAAALKGGDRSVQRFIARSGAAMQTREITEGERPWFANWNEPSDLRRDHA